MFVEKFSCFLWKLKNNEAPNTNFGKIDLNNVNFMLNTLFCRQIFNVMDKSESEEKLSGALNDLFEKKPKLQKWVLEMSLEENVFQKILKLNLISEKAKPHPA